MEDEDQPFQASLAHEGGGRPDDGDRGAVGPLEVFVAAFLGGHPVQGAAQRAPLARDRAAVGVAVQEVVCVVPEHLPLRTAQQVLGPGVHRGDPGGGAEGEDSGAQGAQHGAGEVGPGGPRYGVRVVVSWFLGVVRPA